MLGMFHNNVRNNNSVTALSEDNERLRRSNNMLMSELQHMRKLYNDIIYFVQNHVKPVAPSNAYHPSSLMQKQHQHGSFSNVCTNPNRSQEFHSSSMNNVVDDNANVNGTKLFGVPLMSKKRVHPEYGSNTSMVENHKARLVLENEDLGLNLMPPSHC